MTQLFPVDKNSFVQKYLKRMQSEYMSEPELYFDPCTGELFDKDMPTSERLLVSANPGNYPIFEQDDYVGYFHHDRVKSKEEAIKFWKRE